MTAKKEGEEARACRNEWEMVSLTDSTYAAAHGLEEVELKNDDSPSMHVDDAGESSNLVRSHHFDFLPSQHGLSKERASDNGEEDRGQENAAEMHATGDQSKGKGQIDSVSEGLDKDYGHNNSNEDKETEGPKIVAEVHAKGDKSKNKNETGSVSKGLNMEDHFVGMKLADPGDDTISSHDAAFGEGKPLEGLNLGGKEKSIYDVDTKAAVEIPSTYVENLADSEVAASGTSGDIKDLSPTGSYSTKAAEDEKSCGSDLPCEAWWKRRAASFYAHAKEANAFWSVFVAAAVLGLVVLGQRWQQEKRQVMQHCQHQ